MIDHALVVRFERDTATLADIAADERLGVAVSGGSDSLALLLLAAAAFPGRVAAVSIDHGLREAAADECRFVAETCDSLLVPHDMIAVTVVSDGKGPQAAARSARRQAFGGWCHRRGLRWLLTGHQADDQAETVLMRLARGSGVTGLSGMAARSRLWAVPAGTITADPNPDPCLLRPLLGWTRTELAAIVAQAGFEPVVDPSNTDPRFDRTRFRAMLAQTELFDPRRLATVARNCQDAEEALAFTALQVARAVKTRHEPGRIELDSAQLTRWPRDIVRRVVSDMFSLVADHPEPRGTQLMRLVDLLKSGRTATLAGLKAVPKGGTWTFTPAPPHRLQR